MKQSRKEKMIERIKATRERKVSVGGLQAPITYVDIYIDVWSQACQGIHIDVVVTKLRGGGAGGCARGGSDSWS